MAPCVFRVDYLADLLRTLCPIPPAFCEFVLTYTHPPVPASHTLWSCGSIRHFTTAYRILHHTTGMAGLQTSLKQPTLYVARDFLGVEATTQFELQVFTLNRPLVLIAALSLIVLPLFFKYLSFFIFLTPGQPCSCASS